MAKNKLTVNKAVVDSIAKSPEMTAFLLEISEYGANRARARVPVDTGALKDSIYASAEPGHGEFGADTDYALFVEMGTSKMVAQPYIRPAVDDIKSKYGKK